MIYDNLDLISLIAEFIRIKMFKKKLDLNSINILISTNSITFEKYWWECWTDIKWSDQRIIEIETFVNNLINLTTFNLGFRNFCFYLKTIKNIAKSNSSGKLIKSSKFCFYFGI